MDWEGKATASILYILIGLMAGVFSFYIPGLLVPSIIADAHENEITKMIGTGPMGLLMDTAVKIVDEVGWGGVKPCFLNIVNVPYFLQCSNYSGYTSNWRSSPGAISATLGPIFFCYRFYSATLVARRSISGC